MISDALLGNKNSLGRKRPDGAGRPSVQIEVLDLESGIQTVYPSISEADRTLNIPKSVISLYFTRNQVKPYKGIGWLTNYFLLLYFISWLALLKILYSARVEMSNLLFKSNYT